MPATAVTPRIPARVTCRGVTADSTFGGSQSQVITADNTSYTYFGFRQDLAPFDDVRVRRAFYHAIDIPAIVKEVLQGYGVISS